MTYGYNGEIAKQEKEIRDLLRIFGVKRDGDVLAKIGRVPLILIARESVKKEELFYPMLTADVPLVIPAASLLTGEPNA